MRARAPIGKAAVVQDPAAAHEALRMLLVALPERLGMSLVAVALMAGLIAYAAVGYALPFWGTGLWGPGLWCAWLLAAHAFGYCLHRAFTRAAPAADELPRWARLYCGAAIFTGLGWGSAFLLFLPVPAPVEAAMTVLFAAEVVGAATGSAGWFVASVASSCARLLPMALAFALLRDPPHLALAAGALVTLGLLIALCWRLHQGILRVVRLLLDNRQLSADLALRTREAEAANLAKSRFLAAASHDLGQPVHAVRMLLGVLRRQQLDAAQAATVERLERSANALSSLFDGLLDTAKLDAEVVQPELELLTLRPLLQELQREFEAQAQVKGLRLHLRCPELQAVSDATLLLRVLRNLLANAIRYTERGGVLLAARRRAGAIVIEVWDSGIGIPEHARELVFEEFQQLVNVQRNGLQGAGLGLAIVRRLLRLLGHPLELHSREHRGTLFRVHLSDVAPSVVSPRRAAPDIETLVSRRASGLQGAGIVVIEGGSAARDALCELLRSWGCTTFAFASVLELQTAFASMRGPPQLLLCSDRLADGMSALDVVVLLREEFNRDIPALLFSEDPAAGSTLVAGVVHVQLLHKTPSPDALWLALTKSLSTAG